MILTKDQSRAMGMLERFIKDPDAPIAVLGGGAGTGKTTVSSHAVKNLFDANEVAVTAPTHKAVGVLQEKAPLGVPCCTIHSLLGLRPKRQADMTVLVHKPSYDPSDLLHIRYVLLDEGSMADSELTYNHILKDARRWGRKYIIVGDPYQLNPVGEITTPCFDIDVGPYRVELEETVRFSANNPIIMAATEIRKAIKEKRQPGVKQILVDGVGIHLLRGKDWEGRQKEMAEQYGDAYFRENKIVAYRNQTVLEHNARIRKYLGLDLSVPFTKGEGVVAKTAFVQDDDVLVNTGEEFVVDWLEPMIHPVYTQLEGWWVGVSRETGDIKVPVLNSDKCFDFLKNIKNKLIATAKQSGDWRPFYTLDEYWCDLRSHQALTGHGSQGSTFDNVYLDYKDIYSNKLRAEADRCYYVGVTRPRYNAYIRY